METALLPSTTIGRLLSSKMDHGKLPGGQINCSLIGDVFLELEKLKKKGLPMTRVISKSCEFHRAVGVGAATVAPLDVQSLENGLFDNSGADISFFSAAVDCAKPPCHSVNVIVARDFDHTWATNFASAMC